MLEKATATIVADSISPTGERIATMQLRYWRAIHPEFLTHRVFSRNSGSSRARPVKGVVGQILDGKVYGPLYWGKNRKGMQASEEAGNPAQAERLWRECAREAATRAEAFSQDLGIHKQAANRILEPYTYIDTVVTSTQWDNFFKLRNHADAQPEMTQLAIEMLTALEESSPQPVALGGWHLPYVTPGDRELYNEKALVRMSAARCARTSYRAFSGEAPDPQADLDLANRLLDASHMSPFEHQATPRRGHFPRKLQGNFIGWNQARSMIQWSYL